MPAESITSTSYAQVSPRLADDVSLLRVSTMLPARWKLTPHPLRAPISRFSCSSSLQKTRARTPSRSVRAEGTSLTDLRSGTTNMNVEP